MPSRPQQNGQIITWAELWLVNKISYTVWGKIQPLKTMLTLLDFGIIFENPKTCRQIIGMSHRNIFHAPKSSQMPYTAKNKRIYIFSNTIKKPLELRLGKDPNLAAEKNVDTSRFWTGKPNSCNHLIYHFHILELLNLDFSKCWGWGELIN